jgi:large subunit ribosomal protein L10
MAKKESTNKVKANVSDKKKKLLKDLVQSLLNHNTIMVSSIKSMPCSQFQTIKKKLKNTGKTQTLVIKKRIMMLAMDEAAKTKSNIKELEKFLEEGEAILFSNTDTFELSGMLADNKVSVKAKPGQEAPEDLTVEAGPTDIPAGPMISELSEVGIKVKVENGKLSIMKDTTITKKGEKIKANVAAILSRLDILPFKIGLTPLASFDSKENKVFENIKIDKEETMNQVSLASTQAINLGINSNYPCEFTIKFLIGKASLQANAINSLAPNTSAEKPAETQTSTENTEINSHGG